MFHKPIIRDKITIVVTLESCQWGAWPSEWEKCTASCRGGTEKMSRTAKNEPKFEETPCNPRFCLNNDNDGENCGTRQRSCNNDITCEGPGNLFVHTSKCFYLKNCILF